MPALYFKNYADARVLNDNPFINECIYCKYQLEYFTVDDTWPISDNPIKKVHKKTYNAYKHWHGLEDCYLNLNMDTKSIEVYIQFCKKCGWWRLVKDIMISAETWQIWSIKFGCIGTLKNLEEIDLYSPIEEIRNFLCAKYEKRHYINPRVFEITVASVFKSLGYNEYVTGYTHDGGIDIVLRKNEMEIGVQVKCTKNKISVEQIRSFIGAMVVSGYNKGLYVTASSYEKGANKIIEKISNKIHLQLYDSVKFYEALEIAQLFDDDFEKFKNDLIVNKPEIFYYGWDTPNNSL